MYRRFSFINLIAIVSILINVCLANDSDANAQILAYNFENNGKGVYKYSYETSNGLKKQETGEEIPSIHDETKRAALVRGSYSYPGPDGIIYTVNYVADESGFHPEGDHIKVPPFTPWIPGQPIDDGQYRQGNGGSINQRNEQDAAVSRLIPNLIRKDSVGDARNIPSFVRTTPSPPQSPVTQEYLPTFQPKLLSRNRVLEPILNADGSITRSNAVTPKYLPATNQQQFAFGAATNNNVFRRNGLESQTYQSTKNNNYPNKDILRNALFNKPTPHPDIVIHSTPNESLISAESKRIIDSRKYLAVKRNIS